MHVFLGLGTNLGDREANLVMEPLDGLDQPKYLNQVVECQTELSPRDLLLACKKVEAEMGRPMKTPNLGNVQLGFGKKDPEENPKWDSRIIDIDILFYGDWIVREADLTIPHYALQDRPFVLAGLCELAPHFVHPVLKKPLKALLSDA